MPDSVRNTPSFQNGARQWFRTRINTFIRPEKKVIERYCQMLRSDQSDRSQILSLKHVAATSIHE